MTSVSKGRGNQRVKKSRTSILTDKSIKVVRTELYCARAKWYDIGIELGIPVGDLKSIKAMCDTPSECLLEALEYWLKQVDPKPSWKTLISALEQPAVGEKQLAYNLRQKYYPFSKQAKMKQTPSSTHRPTQWKQLTSFICQSTLLFLIFLAVIWNQRFQIIDKYEKQIYHSQTLPRIEDQVFVGRTREFKKIAKLLNFVNSPVRIISITGSPGFGKSSLAIRAGYEAEKTGIAVYYTDLAQALDMKSMREELKKTVTWEDRHLYRTIQDWAKQLKNNSLLILDNCDSILHRQKDEVQNFLKVITKQSGHLKILLTAQQVTSFTGLAFEYLLVKQLSLGDAMTVLQSISPKITSEFAKKLARLVGEVPLALQVVGTLLKEQTSESLYIALQQDLIRTLSPEALPPDERVATTLNISYHYLSKKFRICGRILANFPGSFHFEPAHVILKEFGKLKWHSLPGPWEHSDTQQCLDVLRRRSLLTVNWHLHSYSFHQLIQKFFKYNQKKEDKQYFLTNVYDVMFELHHLQYYLSHLSKLFDAVLQHSEQTYRVYQHYLKFDQERENYHFPYKYARGYHNHFNKSYIDINTAIEASNHSVLMWKSMMISKPALVQKGVSQMYVIIAIYETVEQQMRLKTLGSVGYLASYVHLLITLCRMESALYNSSYALKNYLLKYKMVLQYHSNASSSDTYMSDLLLIKYLSRLAHLYLIRNEYDSFMESWQDILHLRMKKCQNVSCSHIELGLKAFGNREYRITIKYLEPYVKSRRISLSRRARLFVIVHYSFVMNDEIDKARLMLDKDFNLTFEVIQYHIPSNNDDDHFYHEFVSVDPFESLTYLLLYTDVDQANYRTYMIMATFYHHWEKEVAATDLIQRVLIYLDISNEKKYGYRRRHTLLRVIHNKDVQNLFLGMRTNEDQDIALSQNASLF